MNWRYATKKFDKNRKIDESTFNSLIETLRLSPSSYGLQPWKFIIVNNPEIREKLKEVGHGQSQITDASHFIVFANKTNIDEGLINEYLSFIAKEKGIDVESLSGFKNMIMGVISGRNNEDLKNWAGRQVYLAAGVLLTSCAVLNIDACPMEGIDTKEFDKILGLNEMNLESKMAISIGYRDISDTHMTDKKIRFPKNDIFVELN